jgi:hypothetical protein
MINDEINIGDEIRWRWNESMQWSLGIYRGETDRGFEVYDLCIELPEYIECCAEISVNPHWETKVYKSDRFKDRNYKNYNFSR